MPQQYAGMAKMVNAPDLGSGDWEFESLSLYNAPLAQTVEAKDLKSFKSKFESWVEYKTCDVTASMQEFDSCWKGSIPFRSSRNSSKAGQCNRLKICGYRFESCLFHHRNIVQMDRTLGYEPRDASSSLAIPTMGQMKINYAWTLRSTDATLSCTWNKHHCWWILGTKKFIEIRSSLSGLPWMKSSCKWWGGLSSLDKLGNKDKSMCRPCIWRLFSEKIVQVSKQQTYFDETSGATAERS